MRTQMNEQVTKRDVMRRLSSEFDALQKNKKSKYNDRVYMNLPVTRLERVFFRILAERMGLDKTKLLRRVISTFMNRYPSIVAEAKAIIDEDMDAGDN